MTPTTDDAHPSNPEGEAILALERQALARWGRGDPDGFLELSAPDVTYFDPLLNARLDGRDTLARYYAGVRGKIHIARSEILEPRVQVAGDVAVLSYRFVSYGGTEDAYRWNCTEVYRRGAEGWRIIHTHWAFTNGARV